MGHRLGSVDEPYEDGKSDEQHRPRKKRCHSEHREAAGYERRRVSPPTRKLGYPRRERAQFAGRLVRTLGKRSPSGAPNPHAAPHALSGSAGAAAGAEASAMVRG